MLFDVSSVAIEAQKSIPLGRENASDHWPLETVPSLASLKSSSRLVPSTSPDTFSYSLNVAFSGRHLRSSCPVMVCTNDSVTRRSFPCPQRGISRSRISACLVYLLRRRAWENLIPYSARSSSKTRRQCPPFYFPLFYPLLLVIVLSGACSAARFREMLFFNLVVCSLSRQDTALPCKFNTAKKDNRKVDFSCSAWDFSKLNFLFIILRKIFLPRV